MRRRSDSLIPLEVRILSVAVARSSDPTPDFHGFELAQLLAVDGADGQADTDARRLVGHGTLYKALARLAERGLLESRWEDPDSALAAGRPRRRFYRVTPAGAHAHASALTNEPTVPHAARSLGVIPS